MSRRHGNLGPLLATMLVAGSMIGSGVYLLPASLGAIGSISVLAWLAAIVAALIFAGVFAWLATLGADGGLGFVGSIATAFGQRPAFVAAVLYWLQGVLGNVALALAVTGYLSSLFPALGEMRNATACTIGVIWLLVGLNLAGPRIVAQLEGWTLLLGLAPVLAAGILGWFYFDPDVFAASWNVSGKPVFEVLPQGVVLVLWAFLGLESACLATGMLRDPGRTAPVATIGGVLLAAIVYLSACTALMGIMPASTLAASAAPFADAAGRMAGGSFAALVAVCATLKAGGTLAGWVLLTSAAGQQAVGLGAPRASGPTSPSVANFLVNGLLLTAIALLIASPSIASQFTAVINAAVILMLCVYGMAGAALLRLQRGRVEPARRVWARLLGALSVILVLAVMGSQGAPVLLLTGGTIAAALVAWPAVRHRAQRPRD